MGEPVEKITVEFHLDENGCVVDATSPEKKDSVAHPEAPHAWASAIISTKHSPGCIYVWTGRRWKRICS